MMDISKVEFYILPCTVIALLYAVFFAMKVGDHFLSERKKLHQSRQLLESRGNLKSVKNKGFASATLNSVPSSKELLPAYFSALIFSLLIFFVLLALFFASSNDTSTPEVTIEQLEVVLDNQGLNCSIGECENLFNGLPLPALLFTGFIITFLLIFILINFRKRGPVSLQEQKENAHQALFAAAAAFTIAGVIITFFQLVIALLQLAGIGGEKSGSQRDTVNPLIIFQSEKDLWPSLSDRDSYLRPIFAVYFSKGEYNISEQYTDDLDIIIPALANCTNELETPVRLIAYGFASSEEYYLHGTISDDTYSQNLTLAHNRAKTLADSLQARVPEDRQAFLKINTNQWKSYDDMVRNRIVNDRFNGNMEDASMYPLNQSAYIVIDPTGACAPDFMPALNMRLSE